MDKILRDIYYDQKHEASFSTAIKLHKAASQIDKSIKLEDVKQWLKGELTYTLHKPSRRRFPRNPIHVSRIDELWEADLVDMQEFVEANDGYKYILTVIDCFSKFAFAVALKDKSGLSLKNAFEKLFEKRRPQTLRTDKGKEFLNHHVRRLLRENSVNFTTSKDSTIKCAIVERFNRTLKGRMFKYFTANGTRRYLNVLCDLIEAYNSTYHRSIKMAPSQVTYFNAPKVYDSLFKRTVYKPKVKALPGDNVRIKYDQKVFDKSFYPNWTDKVYQVVGIRKGLRKPVYKVAENVGQEDERAYHSEEIQQINPRAYRIEKALQRKTYKGKQMIEVKWLGYPDEYNSWIYEDQLVNLR